MTYPVVRASASARPRDLDDRVLPQASHGVDEQGCEDLGRGLCFE